MMKNLLYKEFKLALHPIIFVIPFLDIIMMIASYPWLIVLVYAVSSIVVIFAQGKGNQDVLFTVSLPNRKRDVVRARVYTVVALELLQVVAAIPCAFIRNISIYKDNIGSMYANVAFFGFGFIMYAILNIIFLPMFYKTAYKTTKPILYITVAAVMYVIVIEFAVSYIPFFKNDLNTLGTQHILSQLIVLFVGIVIFILMSAISYKKAAKNFEKVDL